MTNRNPRLSLTSKQRESAAGVDLLALCQRVTADGSITADEAEELMRWLRENPSADIPAISYLRGTVERIIADGKVTKEELDELHKAIERIMPPEFRIVSQRVRKDRERHDAMKRKPLAWIDSMVAGVTFEGRAYVVHQHVAPGDSVFLVRDRNNRYSRAAIEVRVANGMQIGYVPDDEAQRVAPLLDQGALHIARVKLIWPGRRVDVPIIEARLYAADSEVEGCVAEKDCPAKVAAPSSYRALAETVMRDVERPTVSGETRAARIAASGCGSAVIVGLAVLLIVLFATLY